MRMVRTKDGRAFAQNYQPKESRNWKATAQAHMRMALDGHPPFSGPVELIVEAHFTCPRSTWRKRDPRGKTCHTKRPDLDNVLKAIADAAKGVLWFDDSQVCSARVLKMIAAQEEAPRIELSVRPLEEDPRASQLVI